MSNKPETKVTDEAARAAEIIFKRLFGRTEDSGLSENEAAEIISEVVHLPELLAVVEAASHADCTCSIRERQSGHRSGCWKPDLSTALKALDAAKGGGKG